MPNLTVVVGGLKTSFSAVNPEIQQFVSDVVYRVYYNRNSELRNVSGGSASLSPSAVLDIISDVYTKAILELVPVYPGILSANMRIEDYFVSSNALKINSVITVNTTTPQIFEEVTVEVRI